MAAANSRIKVFEHSLNLGFGPTIRESYTLPDSEWVFILPGDGQIPPSELFKLYAQRDRYDFILGHRVRRNDPPLRRFNSWSYNRMLSLLARHRIHDVNSVGLLKRSVLNEVSLESGSAFIHAEIFLKILRKGAPILEVPIDHKPRQYGKGSGNKWKIIFSTVQDMLKYFLKG